MIVEFGKGNVEGFAKLTEHEFDLLIRNGKLIFDEHGCIEYRIEGDHVLRWPSYESFRESFVILELTKEQEEIISKAFFRSYRTVFGIFPDIFIIEIN